MRALLVATVIIVCVVVTSSGRRHHMRRSRADPTGRPHHRGQRGRELGRHIPWFSVTGDWGHISFSSPLSWTRGPNVCEKIIENEDTLATNGESSRGLLQHGRHMFTTSCDDTGTAYKCTTVEIKQGEMKKTTKIQECCHGYQREFGKTGCPKALELVTLMSTLERLNASEMQKAIKGSELEELLNDGNYTIFVPSNAALLSYTPVMDSGDNMIIITPDVMSMADSLGHVIAGHVVEGFVRSSVFEDDLLLDTENPSTQLRVNLFNSPKKMITVNCIPVTSTDHLATNGVIHTVNQMLLPVKDSMFHVINNLPQLSVLKTVISQLALEEKFKSSGHLTLFAPTDTAFNKLSSTIQDHIFHSNKCLKNILLHHMMSEIVCSSVIEGMVKVRNMLDQQVNLSRSSDGKHILLDRSEVIQADIMTTNGVIHLIDELSVPQSALNILSVIEQTGVTHALRLFEAAGLTETLKFLENFTIFLPSNEALQTLPPELEDELGKNTERLTEILKYHIVPRESRCTDLLEDGPLPSLHDEHKILVQQYRGSLFGVFGQRQSKLTAQCAPISKMNIGSCGGVAHVVEKLLIPPEKGVMDILYQNRNFSKFLALLRDAGYVERLQQSPTFTIFAPTNAAFDLLSDEETNQLKDETIRERIIKQHIVPKFLCCSAAITEDRHGFGFFQRYTTLDGLKAIRLRRDDDDRITANGRTISLCDQTAKNGVVHGIDRFLVSGDDYRNHFRDLFSIVWE